jgi:hypothetical protein
MSMPSDHVTLCDSHEQQPGADLPKAAPGGSSMASRSRSASVEMPTSSIVPSTFSRLLGSCRRLGQQRPPAHLVGQAGMPPLLLLHLIHLEKPGRARFGDGVVVTGRRVLLVAELMHKTVEVALRQEHARGLGLKGQEHLGIDARHLHHVPPAAEIRRHGPKPGQIEAHQATPLRSGPGRVSADV